jgi:hypothetical protein
MNLSRLALYIAKIKTHEVPASGDFSLNQWKNMLRELIKKISTEDKPICFIIDEGQLFEP